MNAMIEFNPEAFSAEALKLILRKAQKWNWAPAEAVSRLLDEAAAKAGKQPEQATA